MKRPTFGWAALENTMLALTLFLIAAWGWFSLVNFHEGAPLTGFLLIPLLLPPCVAAMFVGLLCRWLNNACHALVGFLHDIMERAAELEIGHAT